MKYLTYFLLITTCQMRLFAVNESAEKNGTQISEQKVEKTLSILKPDAVKGHHIGEIISRFEDKGLHVVAIKMVRLNRAQAAKFYHVHEKRPFFNDLVNFMSSGPIVVMVLEGNRAINKNRSIMGATNPATAEGGTIRADFAKSITENAVHGSDSAEAAQEEIRFFFESDEVFSNN